VVVTGFGLVDAATYHIHTVRYGPDGQFQWYREFDGVGTSGDNAAARALDPAGNAYIAGLTNFPPQNRDITAVKYTPAGDEAWSVHWPGPSGTNDAAGDIAVAPSGDVLVVGLTWMPEEANNAVTILYRPQDLTAATPPPAAADLDVAAALNPFSHGTEIRYRLGRPGAARLAVYDLRGRRVRVLEEGFAPAGDHARRWNGRDDQGRTLPSGTYVLRLETARGVASGRVGLVR